MNLFAYGTLMDPEIMRRVSGATCPREKAALRHFIRRRLREEVYPGIIARQGGRVEGVLYLGLPPQAFERLDRFEGALYVRTPVSVVGGDGRRTPAQAYVIGDRFVERLSDEEWSFRRFLEKERGRFVSGYRGYGRL